MGSGVGGRRIIGINKYVLAIRKAHKDDAQEIWDIRSAAIHSECKDYYSSEELEVWTSGETPAQFVKAVEDNFYVAILDGHVVGTGMINLESGKVDAIFIHPSHVRAGIGRQVLCYLERLAVDAGLAELCLDSTLNAAPFYRKCGFIGDSVAQYDSPKGISLDCIPMIKKLRLVDEK